MIEQMIRLTRTRTIRGVLLALVALGPVLLLALPSAPSQAATTFIVNSTGDGADINLTNIRCDASTDDGDQCTLRAAIQEANDTAGADTIEFNIGGSANLKTISPTSPLPTIVDPLTIDGYTQAGASPNTLEEGNDAVLNVELDGLNAGPGVRGLSIDANDCTIKGLIIKRFSDSGVYILGIGGGNRVEGNFIGVNRDGITDRGNSDGVFVQGASNTPNTVGGTEPEMRNVISGNDGNGVFFGGTGSSETKVQGNYIGTTADGTADLGNLFSGVSVTGDSNTIGGTEAGARNFISGNGENGVFVRDSRAKNNEVKGNYVGTTGAGTEPLANGMHGVSILGASDNTVGGTALGAGNVISGNGFHGVSVTGSVSGATGNTIEGNYIGTDADGSGDLGNGLHGISIFEADSNAVGGTLAGAANRIAHNGGDGVSIDGLFVDPIGNSILSNRIFDNDGLGIDLNDDGVTPNDTGDTDTGPNNLQNFPVITSARKPTTSRITTISGRLKSNPSQEFAVQCFLTNGALSSAYGEGSRLLDTAVASTDATGIASFSCESRLALLGQVPGQTVSATATDVLTGDTSEFSKNKTITTVP